MNTRQVILFFFLFSTANHAAHPEADSFSVKFRRVSGATYLNCIGYTSGISMGKGFSYRRWINSRNAVQLTIGPYCFVDSGGRPLPSVLIGPAVLMNFAKFNYFRFLGFASGNFAHVECDQFSNNFFWVGVGGGIEYYIWKFCSVVMMGVSTPNGKVSFSPDFGVYFRF